jgi:hypothetical protein
MKCYTHPALDAIGVCSQCGRGICTQCAKTIAQKLICENCSPAFNLLDPTKRTQYGVLSATLGGLGAINILLIGVYSALKLYHLGIMRGYQLEIYFVSILTLFLTLTLLYGSYSLWKTRFKRGGRFNLLAGGGILSLYWYFTWVTPLLSEFGVVGLLLCIPSLLSGVLGVLADRTVIPL